MPLRHPLFIEPNENSILEKAYANPKMMFGDTLEMCLRSRRDLVIESNPSFSIATFNIIPLNFQFVKTPYLVGRSNA